MKCITVIFSRIAFSIVTMIDSRTGKAMNNYLTMNELQFCDEGAVCDRCLKEILDRMLSDDDYSPKDDSGL